MSGLIQKTHYEVLGVEREASQAEIRSAYKEKLLSTHPDKTNKQLDSSNLIPQIKEAYRVLNDSATREEYDEELMEAFKKHGLVSTGDGLDIFTLDDFTCIEEEDIAVFKRDCPRCTEIEGFVLNEDDLSENGTSDGMGGYEIIVQCSACSLWLKVKYYDLQAEEEEE